MRGLLVEAALLFFRIVDLRVRVPELHPGGEVLEALGQLWVVVHEPRERRELDRVPVDDRRLDQARLDEVAERVVDELGPVLVGARVHASLLEPRAKLLGVARPELELLERVDEADALPGCLQVDLVAPERRDRRPEDLERDALEQLLDPRHRVAVVGVRLVPLEHRELRLVLVRDALVAEVLADLVDALEPSDDQALQVELGRDPQVEIGVELVRMRHERVREGPTEARLQDGRLDLDEALLVEVAADRRDDARPQQEELARVVVHEQVEVALAVARLPVGDTMERVRERAPVRREHLERVDGERGLAAPRLRRPAGDPDHVTEMDVELADPARVAHQLDPAGAVDEVEEDELSHLAPGHDAPREPASLLKVCPGIERVRRRANSRDLVAVGEALRLGHRASLGDAFEHRARLRGVDDRPHSTEVRRRHDGHKLSLPEPPVLFGAQAVGRDRARAPVVHRRVVPRVLVVVEHAKPQDRARHLDRRP